MTVDYRFVILPWDEFGCEVSF